MCGWHRNDHAIWQCFRPRHHSGPCLTYQYVSPTQALIQLAPDEYWLLDLMPPDMVDDIQTDIRALLG